MKTKIIRSISLLAAICLIIIGLFSTANAANSSIEIPRDVGAMFPKGKVVINYVAFKPVVVRNQAILTAKNELRSGYNLDPNAFPVDATVATFSGEVQNSAVRTAVNRPVWIVVIKQLPFQPLGLLSDPSIKVTSQLNVAVDASTGEIIHEVLSGKLPAIN